MAAAGLLITTKQQLRTAVSNSLRSIIKPLAELADDPSLQAATDAAFPPALASKLTVNIAIGALVNAVTADAAAL